MPKILEPILTPQDAAWGRQVNRRQGEIERSQDRALLEQAATNKGLSASIASLSEQVLDLRGRLGYAESSTTSQNWTSTQPANAAWGPTLQFDLSEDRVVSLQFIVAGTVQVYTSSGTSTSGYARLRPMLFLDGSAVGPGQPWLHVDLVGSGSNITAPLAARALITVPAGPHTLQGGFATRSLVSGSALPLFGLISAEDPILFVDVLQPAGA